MDENALTSSLELYRSQLEQVKLAAAASGPSEDLSKLQADLAELIQLTEESLLSVKKAKLLALLEQQTSSDGASTSQPLEQTNQEVVPGSQNSDSSTDSEDGLDNYTSTVIDETCSELVGQKVRAPHSHDWGRHAYHNAMVVSVSVSEDDEPEVNVLFLNPTHRSMVPCQHFLNDSCRYGDNCRNCHGYKVPMKGLKEYVPPDHSFLKLESPCWAKWTDNVWYPGQIVDVFPDLTFKVMFDQGNDVLTVTASDVIPHTTTEDEDDALSSASEAEEIDDDIHGSDTEGADDLPVYLWRPNQTTDKLGDWEQFTRGIGSKLMIKMGYIVGQGLGKESQGKAEPVPILLLPQGKSLDKIMELKELAGDRNLYDVMKQQMKKKKGKQKIEEKEKNKASSSRKADVFKFINKELKKNTADKHVAKRLASQKQITEKDLKEKSDKNLTVQLFKTHEEIRSTEKEIARLKTSLSRNEGKDSHIAKQVTAKIESLQRYIDKLKKSGDSIEKHRSHRSNHKKLTIF